MKRMGQAACRLSIVVALTAACATTKSGLTGTTAASGIDAPQARGVIGNNLQTYLERASYFGFSGSVLVADSQGILVHGGYGLANRSEKIPVTTSTSFDMGSIVKQFTAAAVLTLEQEGRLSLSDSLGKYFSNAPVDKRGIRLHHLLTHSSGLDEPDFGDYDKVTLDEFTAGVFSTPLAAPTGTQFIYSNAGFSLLAAIIEKVTGVEYEQFMHDRFFVPAGMRYTGYNLPAWDASRVAHTYTPPVDQGSPLERLRKSGGPAWMLKGNGGMLTTAGDLYRWELSLKRGMPVPFAAQLKQFAPQFDRGPTLAQGYDWWIEKTEGDNVMYHRGGDANQYGLNAEYRRYPRDGSTIIYLANSRHNGWSARRYMVPALRRIFLGMQKTELPVALKSASNSLRKYEGTYTLDGSSRITVKSGGDHLELFAEGQGAVDLISPNRDSASLLRRRTANEGALEFIRALSSGKMDGLAPFMGGDTAAAQRMRGYWLDAEREYGPLVRMSALGTARMDRGVFLTTIRLEFARKSVPVRFDWSGNRPVLDGDDALLSRFAAFVRHSPVDAGLYSPYWWASPDGGFVTYDLATDREQRFLVEQDSRGRIAKLKVQTPGGIVTLTRM